MSRIVATSTKGSAKRRRLAMVASVAAHKPLATEGSDDAAPSIDGQRRQALIAEAAYYQAQARGFTPGAAIEDWLAAESEVDRRLMAL
jgi:hypothetical protein